MCGERSRSARAERKKDAVALMIVTGLSSEREPAFSGWSWLLKLSTIEARLERVKYLYRSQDGVVTKVLVVLLAKSTSVTSVTTGFPRRRYAFPDVAQLLESIEMRAGLIGGASSASRMRTPAPVIS